MSPNGQSPGLPTTTISCTRVRSSSASSGTPTSSTASASCTRFAASANCASSSVANPYLIPGPHPPADGSAPSGLCRDGCHEASQRARCRRGKMRRANLVGDGERGIDIIGEDRFNQLGVRPEHPRRDRTARTWPIKLVAAELCRLSTATPPQDLQQDPREHEPRLAEFWRRSAGNQTNLRPCRWPQVRPST